jgi:hypothetical protein
MMGVLHDVETHTINDHLKKVFTESELQADSVIQDFRITAADRASEKRRLGADQAFFATVQNKLHWADGQNCPKKTASGQPGRVFGFLERLAGIEPALFAWEARVLPLNDSRLVG